MHPETTTNDGKAFAVLDVVVVLGLGLCCLPIMLLLILNIKQPLTAR
jgi:hypothetical protein